MSGYIGPNAMCLFFSPPGVRDLVTLCFELVGRPVIWRGQGLQEEGGVTGGLGFFAAKKSGDVWIVKGIILPF